MDHEEVCHVLMSAIAGCSLRCGSYHWRSAPLLVLLLLLLFLLLLLRRRYSSPTPAA